MYLFLSSYCPHSIEPHNPPPPINFLEWDGFVRICFLRKNKTMGAIFKLSTVEELLEKNYRTHCAMNGVEPDEDPDFVKNKVAEILAESGMETARATKMTQDEYLKLLAMFNEAGFHFA